MTPSIYRSLVLGIPLLLICCTRAPGSTAGDPSGPLKPCPASPNCVSTEAADPDRRMAPLPYRVDRLTSRALVLSIIESMPRTTVVTAGEHYLHVEFRSAVFGFVDDVAFVFDDTAEVIRFRSASRSGYWDLGVNRRRMHAIGEAYRNALLDDGAGLVAMT
jgi:uncharacterized protein (DUF1499 family)